GSEKIQTLEKRGISRNRILLDPGIGFGKTAGQSLAILKDVRRLREWGVRILVGHSRKSFLSPLTEKPFPERDIETLSASVFLTSQEVDYLRVHNIEAHSRAFKITQALMSPAGELP